MKKIIIIPDSYKGTMSSSEICIIMKQAILRHLPDAEILSVPVADGGEGSVDTFIAALGGQKILLKTKGPYSENIDSFYGILQDKVAVIEMAASAGLPLVDDNKCVEKTTTFGVGQLILDALNRNCKKIIVGLGGSATNDGGCGAAAALGVVFKDVLGDEFIPTGETLVKINNIDISGLDKRLKNVELITMCDIDNLLCGEFGAAHVFAPQKGADDAMVKVLDAGLLHMAKIVRQDIGIDILHLSGAGAAGGMGGGMVAFFNSSLQMGIEAVLDTVCFDSLLDGVDFVLTGEGKIDAQSLRGKVVIGVARRAKAKSVPVIAIVGDIGDNIESAYENGVSAIFSINRVAVPYKEAKLRAKNDLYLTIDNMMRFCKIGL